MAKYLLVESRDPWEYAEVGYFTNMAKDLASNGNDVTLFLIQNGVFMARKGANPSPLTGLSGVKVVADEFCLKERAIKSDNLAAGVSITEVGSLVDMLLEDGVKAVWH